MRYSECVSVRDLQSGASASPKSFGCMVAGLLLFSGAAPAFSQSSVTFFGVVDTSLSRYSVSDRTGFTTPVLPGATPAYYASPKKSQTVLANGANSSSRFGMRGTEDLGGGLAASFWLEAPLASDSGSTQSRPIDFSRRATVSLSGGFGELRLGRDFTPTYWNDTVFNPFASVGVGSDLQTQLGSTAWTGNPKIPSDPNYVRASNGISYFLPPTLGGVYGQFTYTLGENTRSTGSAFDVPASNKGRYVGGRIGFAKGPFDIAVGYGESTLESFGAGASSIDTSSAFLNAFESKSKIANIGGAWDLGLVKLVGEVSQVRTSFEQPAIFAPNTGLPIRAAVNDVYKNKGWQLGALIPVGPGVIKLSYSQIKTNLPAVSTTIPFGSSRIPYSATPLSPTYEKIAIGYVHNLSKRTAVYATIARLSNKNGAALPVGGGSNSLLPITGSRDARSIGYDLGLRVAF